MSVMEQLMRQEAKDALADGNYLLAGALCHALSELELARAVGAHDQANPLERTMRERTVAVPLLRMNGRAEQPRTAQDPVRCVTCGGQIWFTCDPVPGGPNGEMIAGPRYATHTRSGMDDHHRPVAPIEVEPCSGGRCPDPVAHAEGAHDV